METFQVRPGWIAATVIAVAIEIGLPVVLGLVARRRLGVGWRYFGYGALIFFLFQVLTRIPLVVALQAALAPQIQRSPTLLWAMLVGLSLTAGLFEEVGRYLGYRVLMRREEKTWDKAVMYGLGHGGIESVLIGGLATAGSLIGLLALSAGGLEQVPPEQRAIVAQQLASIATLPDWAPLLGAWERLWAMVFHVSLALMVLQVFRRGSLRWLWMAVLAHALFNLAAVGSLQVLGQERIVALVIVEAIIGILAAASLWVAWTRFRDEDVKRDA